MSGQANKPDSLRKLERLRELQLERAQIEHASAAGEAAAKKHTLEQAESDVVESQSFAREQLQSRALSAHALIRIHAFAVFQEQQLDAAHADWRASQDQWDAAQKKVVERFAELSVIEKLRARRRIEAGKTQARMEQKRLDEQGLTHLAAAKCKTTTDNGR